MLISCAKMFFVCVLLCVLLAEGDGQRLSQGASDWYMRFHSNFRHVKREVYPPEIKSFIVSSTIKHRYSITEVKTVIENSASVQQDFQFGFVMAKSALISNVTLFGSNGQIIKSTADASEWANCFLSQHDNSTTFDNGSSEPKNKQSMEVDANDNDTVAHANGDHTNAHPNGNAMEVGSNDNVPSTDSCDMYGKNRHGEYLSYLHHREDFKQFVLPMKIAPHSNVTLRFVYEYLLERTDNAYTHTLSVNPGQLVVDFKIHLNIIENRPLKDMKLDIPGHGEIKQFLNGELNENEFLYEFTMNRLEQFDSFGQHGYTGDFMVSYDLEEGNGAFDLITKDDFFVHFYDVPERMTMKSIPKHVYFLLDTSESMSGAKLCLAKSSVLSLIDSLDDTHSMSLLTFDSQVNEWHYDPASILHSKNITHNNASNVNTFPCTNDTHYAVTEYFDALNSTVGTQANITRAIEKAIEMDHQVWSDRLIPENALSMVILLTDGRSASINDSEIVGKEIRILNKEAKIPIFSIGIGFDASMEFLEDIAETSCGRICMINIFEDFEDVENQLRDVERHLNNMVFKNLNFEYIGDVFVRQSLTQSTFRAFHQGGSVVVAGQFDVDHRYPKFQFKLSGQSANGPYIEERDSTPFVTNGCKGQAILCSSPNFGGDCVSIQRSTSSLQTINFDDNTVSVNITGNCAWIAYDQINFGGKNITLMPGKKYGGLPGWIHNSISSLRMVALEQVNHIHYKNGRDNTKQYRTIHQTKDISSNTVSRLWAFKTIRDILDRAAENEITKMDLDKAYSLAMKYNFLTPFTVMNFVQMNLFTTVSDESYIRDPVDPRFITYGDLSPIFYNGGMMEKWKILKKCDPPIECEGQYHVERYNNTDERVSNQTRGFESDSRVNCTGSITLYTKTNYSGDALRIEGENIYQLYHEINGQLIRSIQTEGECCWNLFDKLFFAGNSERICGDKHESQSRKMIGSIIRNGGSTNYTMEQ